jgi:hypothetical protein
MDHFRQRGRARYKGRDAHSTLYLARRKNDASLHAKELLKALIAIAARSSRNTISATRADAMPMPY